MKIKIFILSLLVTFSSLALSAPNLIYGKNGESVVPVKVDSEGNFIISSEPPVGGATSSNQTNGAQKTQVVDGSGVNIGFATAANQALQATAANQALQATAANQALQATAANQATQIANDGVKITAPTMPAGGSGIIGWLSAIYYQLTQTLTISGSVTTTSAATSTTGAATPASATLVGGSDGSFLRALSVTAAGLLNTVESRLPAAFGQQSAATSVGVALANENVHDLYLTGQAAQTATIQNILPATSSATATDLTGYRSGKVQVVSTASGGTYIFECTNDSATSANFQTVPVFNQATLTGTPITSAITATSSAIIYNYAVVGRYCRLRIATTITGGSIQAFSVFSQTSFTPSVLQVAQSVAANLLATISGSITSITTSIVPGVAATNLGKAEDAASASGDSGVFSLFIRNDTLTSNVSAAGDYIGAITDIFGALIMKDEQRHKASYRAAFVVAPAATATDIFQLIGSASKTVEITKIIVSGTQTTGGMTDIYVIKRSTANTGGTSSASANVPMNSGDAAATAVGAIYTANPTTGTPVGNIYIESLPLAAVTGTTNNVMEINFGERAKPVQLVGVAQALALNLNSVTVTGGSIKVTVEWTEW